MKYNEKGNLIQEISYDAKGTLLETWTWSYETYDENKNWTKKIGYDNGEPMNICEREIEYY